MTKSKNFYSTSLQLSFMCDPIDLRSRWKKNELSRLRHAISNNEALPRIFAPLKLNYLDGTVVVEDLRGADLSGMHIGDYDLAYCALDYANFDHSHLENTNLQYSRLHQASFQSANIEGLQASPVDARAADFSYSRISRSYFSNSDLSDIRSIDVQVDACDFIESSYEILTDRSDMDAMFVVANSKKKWNESIKNKLQGMLSDLKGKKNVSKNTEKIGTVIAYQKLLNKENGIVQTDFFVRVATKRSRSSNREKQKKFVEYKISGASTAFSVGDNVHIARVNPYEGGGVKVSFSRKRKELQNIQKVKGLCWVILKLADKEEESRKGVLKIKEFQN